MTTARSTCNYCDYTDGFEAPENDVDAIMAGARALRDRLIAHVAKEHPAAEKEHPAKVTP